MTDMIARLNTALEDRYSIERQLGEGGMATVYLANDLKHERKVALKVLKPELAAVVGAERFLAEIKTTANLQHPHILPLHDSGEADGTLYYVMPYVDGESLKERIDREGAMPLESAVGVAITLGKAVDHAHRQGIVHRDIKPANVLIAGGEPFLADFGIALAYGREGAGRLTGTGISVGTPGYMSPEQAMGDGEVDGRTDIYALGALLYEMLVGEPPFGGDNPRSVLTKVLTEEPPSIRSLGVSIPEPIDRAVLKALAKDPDDRFSSAADWVGALQDGASPTPTTQPRKMRTSVALAGLGALVASAVWGVTIVRSAQDRVWARTVAIPEVGRLLGESDQSQALQLAREAEAILPGDPTLLDLIEASSTVVDVQSDPSGARMFYRAYAKGDSTWIDAGTTPITGSRVPTQQLIARFEAEGYRSYQATWIPPVQASLSVRLSPDDTEEDMVWIPPGSYDLGAEPVAVDSFRLDRTEVTNEKFQAFVDEGGYGPGDHWPSFTESDGQELSFEDALARFSDSTGRTGPAGWGMSRFEEGGGDFPVSGVSWFEAAAYCSFNGQTLPSFFHWKSAAGLDVWDHILAFSNFVGSGPVAAGSTGAVGPNGNVDLAGNVREWVWNNTGSRRYILGGAFGSPTYLYGTYEAVDPWSRGATNGFRCANYFVEPDERILAEIAEPFYDFREFEPVDDETYDIFTRFYDYDPAPLEPVVEVVDSTADWIRERVELSTAYGERFLAHVFLPRGVTPPYQTVVYWPGSSSFRQSSSENIAEMAALMFIPQSGRALVYPVLKGSYERRITNRTPGLAAQRQVIVQQTQDLLKTVDYAVERPDLDAERLAYMGVSYGAELAVPVALEKRFSALVLVGAALDPAWIGAVPNEAGPWEFVFRITTPSLVINGRQDVMHPYEESQIPFFDAIDVPDEDKRFEVFDGGHLPSWNEVIRLTLGWLDERLGPVK